MEMKVDNPWRESLENCAKGDNFLRCQEWHDLIDELDRLYLIEEAHKASQSLSAVRQIPLTGENQEA